MVHTNICNVNWKNGRTHSVLYSTFFFGVCFHIIIYTRVASLLSYTFYRLIYFKFRSLDRGLLSSSFVGSNRILCVFMKFRCILRVADKEIQNRYSVCVESVSRVQFANINSAHSREERVHSTRPQSRTQCDSFGRKEQ